MKDLPLYVSIGSHAFFNPLLFYIVRGSIQLRREKKDLRAVEGGKEHTASFLSLAVSYGLRTVVCYGVVMCAVFGVLYLFGVTQGISGFFDVQFLYHSTWRAPIVIVTAINILMWAMGQKPPMVWSFLFGPALQVCMVIQIFLFFKHLY